MRKQMSREITERMHNLDVGGMVPDWAASAWLWAGVALETVKKTSSHTDN